MTLGNFGGSAPIIKRVSGSTGGSAVSNATDESKELIHPSPEGTIADSFQVFEGLRNISHDLVFSASDNNTVAWASGTITLSSGTAFSIDSGDTGNISARTFIFLDIATSETVLQTTTTFSTAVGDRKQLIAVAENVVSASELATFQVFGGIGGFGGTYLSAGNIGLLSVDTQHLALLAVKAGQLDALAVTTAKINLLAIQAGQIDNLTITGGKIGSTQIGSIKLNLGDDAAFGDNLVRNGSFESWMCNRDYNGTIVSSGTAVTGTSTAFATNDVSAGTSNEQKKRISISDLLVSNNGGADTQMSRVASITDDTNLVLAAAFGVNITGDRFYSVCPGPDGWTRTGASSFWDRTQASGEVDHGNAALKLTNAAATAADAGQSITISATQNSGLRSRKVTMCARVKVSTASRVFIKLDDGVDTSVSSNHTGGGAFETLDVTHTLNGSATKLEWSLELSSGDAITAIFDSVVVAEGETCIAFSEARNDVFGQPSTFLQTISDTRTSATAVIIKRATFHNVMVGDNESVMILFNAKCQTDTGDDKGDWTIRRNATTVNGSFQNTMASTGQNYSISYAKVDQKPGKGIYRYSVHCANEAGNTLTIGNTEVSIIRLPAS